MKSRTVRAAVLGLFAALVLATLATAQDVTTGEISGAVLDERDSVPLKGASLTLFNLRNGNRRPARTDSKGNYVFIQLAPGYYDIQAAAMGYMTQERKGIFVPLNLPRVVIPAFKLMRESPAPLLSRGGELRRQL